MDPVLNRFVFSETNAIILFDLRGTTYKTIFLGDNQRYVKILVLVNLLVSYVEVKKKGGTS